MIWDNANRIAPSTWAPPLLVLVALHCASTSAADAEPPADAGHVILFVESKGKFEVLDSRAETTATGFVLFGLIGYAVEEGQRSSNDQKREDAIFVEVPPDACESFLVDAFKERLGEKGYSAEVVDVRPKGIDDAHIMHLKVTACGFRKVNTATGKLSAFFRAEYQLARPGEARSGPYERLSVTGKARKDWEEFAGDIDGSVEEFRATKRKAGRRLANKIIYAKD